MPEYTLGNQIRAGGGARGSALSQIRNNIPKHSEGLEVTDLDPESTGTFPRIIEVQTNDADGAKLFALYHGDLNLVVGDFVACREDASSPYLIIEGLGQATTKSFGSTNSAWPSTSKVQINTTEYSTLSAAITASSVTDLIKVAEGSFTSNGETLDCDLIGSGRDVSIITGSSTSITLSIDDVTLLKDVTIEHTTNGTVQAVSIAAGSATQNILENVTAIANTGAGTAKTGFDISDTATLIDCEARVTASSDALLVQSGGVVIVRGGHFDGDVTVAAGGSLTLRGPTITGTVTASAGTLSGWWYDDEQRPCGSIVVPSVMEGRLSLSGSPVADTTAGTTINYVAYTGHKIAMPISTTGVEAGGITHTAWKLFEFSEGVDASLSGLTADTNYDVFIYDNSGTLDLETVAWSSDTARATALAGSAGGRWLKSGDQTRAYLGTIRITSTTGQCDDNATNRFVWNVANQVDRRVADSTTSTHSYTTASWREWGTSGPTIEFVNGLATIYSLNLEGTIDGDDSGSGWIAFGINGTSSGTTPAIRNTNAQYIRVSAVKSQSFNAGYNFVKVAEYGATGYNSDYAALEGKLLM